MGGSDPRDAEFPELNGRPIGLKAVHEDDRYIGAAPFRTIPLCLVSACDLRTLSGPNPSHPLGSWPAQPGF